ncbi:hypothetical protein [Geomicrobium sp. JCM 19055]|uniref:phage baseplate plug family protein n=1 Tax=Geomicrobium sp. JCM 19055 TaxID=1460649 RepID=UPI00045ECEB5|nr:hypothetical protein [Geomicrobium sp. JCM 19055]GAK01514.1 hypothetical protein JCM19055_4686 [Geomicrobium sp. JCM 19055]
MILPIDVERVPYRFNVELAEELFDFEVHYNGAGDYFTVDLRKNGEDVVIGEKITYGVPLFLCLH